MSTSEGCAKGCAVRLKGVPPKATVEDILLFFKTINTNLDATAVRLMFKERRGAGEAFVAFDSAEDAWRACELDKGFLSPRFGQRFVRVLPAGDVPPAHLPAPTASMTATPVAAGQPAMDVVKLRGVPIRATASDVLAFFSGYSTKRGGVHIQPFSENRHSKVAYVEFATAADAEKALDKDHQRFGKAFGERYCALQRVLREEMLSDLARI